METETRKNGHKRDVEATTLYISTTETMCLDMDTNSVLPEWAVAQQLSAC